jgi:hypothetical protein
VSRILKNPKYVGSWIWNRAETRRDPKTGRKRKFLKPETEWHVNQNEDLRIVPRDVWEAVVARWKEVDRAWPHRRDRVRLSGCQRSYVKAHPPHLLSGTLICGVCGSGMGRVSGKASGYYGCLGAVRNACSNKLLVSRKITEKAILAAFQGRLDDTGSIRYVLEKVEAEVQRLQAHLPKEIELKQAALATEERRIANYIEFIGDGKATRGLGKALQAAEQKASTLRAQLNAYEASARALFKTPPVEWIAERLRALRQVLESEPSQSALVLRRVLGPIKLFPIVPDVGRTYYQAETALQVLDLIGDPEDGSNWLCWWRRWASNPRPETLSSRHLHQ